MSVGWSSSCNKVLDQRSMKLKRSMSCEQVTTFQGVNFDRLIVDAPKKLRQPRDVQRDPPRLILASTFACRASANTSACPLASRTM